MGDREFDSGAAQAFPLKQITKAESSSERRNRQYWNPTSQFDPYGPLKEVSETYFQLSHKTTCVLKSFAATFAQPPFVRIITTNRW